MSMPPASDVRRIACLMLGEIGDLIVTLPAIESLRARYPAAHITFVIRRPLADLVRLHPAVDDLLLYDNRNLIGKLRFVLALLMGKWDLWVDLHTPTHNTWCSNSHVFRRNARLMRFAGTRFRAGFAMPETVAQLTHPQAPPDEHTLQTESIVDTTLRAVAHIGPAPRKRMVVSGDAGVWADTALVGAVSRRFIALFFGAKQPSDVWPVEHVRAFLTQALQAWPAHVFLLIGGPHEKRAAASLEDIRVGAGGRVLDFIGQANLMQTAALLGRCEAMVSTDSGPMHIADAVDVPLVTLFGAKTYLPVWLPQQPRKQVLNHRPECSPCFSSVCPHDNLCMRAITPDAAVHALQTVLRSEA